MKKLNKVLVAALALALIAGVGFALEVTDNSVGGTTAPGALAMNRALVFNAEYDAETDDGVDGTNLVQVLSIPEGIIQTAVVVTPENTDWTYALTLYRKLGTNDWAAVGNAQTVTVDAEVPILYSLVTPTYANTNAANVEVVMSDYDTPQNSQALAVTKWGFLVAVSGTNSLPTEGTINVGVVGFDVNPNVRD